MLEHPQGRSVANRSAVVGWADTRETKKATEAAFFAPQVPVAYEV